jgi:hypothetical protein
MCKRLPPGGEPFWHESNDLAGFVHALHPAKECCNGRLPGIAQRDAFAHGFRFLHTRTIKLRNDETLPGAACFHTFGPD